MQKQEFLTLVDKYLDGKSTSAEERLLLNYYESFQQTEEWDEALLGESKITEARLLQRLQDTITKRQAPVRRLHPFKWVVAASILLLISVGGYFIMRNDGSKQTAKVETQQQRFKNDVPAPGKAKAMITLADGRTVALDSINSGTLATQGDIKVLKTKDGQIVYEGSGSSPSGEAGVRYNTLSNPRGSKVIDMTLGDGSRVWLNAESSLKYPVAFVGKERKVEITGEAYFEVAHNAIMPFTVKKDDAEIIVLGTHFNVNAYDDEASLKITLLEGSVKVAKGFLSGVLKPGQQAQVASEIKLVNADLEETMAWKNGLFDFKKAGIGTIMRQVARWYDVEVVYEATPKGTYSGGVSRNSNVSSVLKILELSDVHFRIEGKKITVIK